MSEQVEIDVTGRWDAIALLQRLTPYRPYLVQFEPEHWLVYAETPGNRGEPLHEALAAIDDCLRERRVDDAVVRIDGRAVGHENHHAPSAPATLR